MTQLKESNIIEQPGEFFPEDDEAREAFRMAMERYERLVKEAEIVQAGLIGGKSGFRTGYIWNVLKEDFTPEQMHQDPRLLRLDEEAAIAIRESRVYMPLRIAHVLPSHLQALVRRYEENGTEIFEHNIEPLSNTDISTSGENTEDILIGRFTPAIPQIAVATQMARDSLTSFNADPKEICRTFNLDVSGRVKQPRAAELIRDIAIARNASDWKGNEGYASAFTLLNATEPIMSEIVYI